MIELKSVNKYYGQHHVLKSVDLIANKGECVVLIGPSGCGKSTLLKVINRMVESESGQVIIEGQEIGSYKPEQLRRQMGYCIQGVGLFPHLSVQENIAVVPKLLKWTDSKIKERIHVLMEISELPLAYLTKRPNQLSGGEAQRVGVCRALAADPPILLMDEPFGAVDPMTREKLQMAFNHIQQTLKKTVVFVTHDVEEAIVLGDRIAIMNAGEIISCKTPGGFSGSEIDAFSKSFLGPEYPIRLLKKYTIGDLMDYLSGGLLSPDPNRLVEISFNETEHGLQPTLKMNSATSLKEVLSELMRHNQKRVQLELPNGKVQWIEYTDIVQMLQAVSQS